MTNQKLLTPTAITEQLQITPITLRRWCDYHRTYLSPLANPGPGQARRFTGRDLDVLKHVRSLRDQGMTTQIINDQLVTLTFPEIDEQPLVDALPDDQQNDHVTGVIPAQQGAIQPYAAQDILSIERRIERLESSREPAFFMGLGIGFIAALLFVIVILGIALLWGGFR